MTERPTWMWRDNAACGKHPHIDWTIEPTETVSQSEVAETREAAANICAGCPVRNWCATEAEVTRLDPDETVRPFGVHAGRFYDGTRRTPLDIKLHDLIRTLVQAGLTDGQIGQRTGLTSNTVRHRRNLLGLPSQAARGPQQQPIKHGTRGGAHAHRKRGEAVCRECLDAQNAYQRARVAQRKEAA